MTAAPTAPPAPAAVADRPRPPRQLRWLLRLHRPAVLGWTAFVLVAGAALLWLGGPLTDASAAAWKEYNACAFDAPCSYDQDAIVLHKDVYLYTTSAVLVAPFLIAAWAGGSLTGRETESGTVRLAWTQGVTPARWLASRLALPAVLTAASTGLLVWLHRLARTAGEGRIDTAKPWHDVPTFYAGGTVPVALALAGLTGGALAGLLLRRSLAALTTAAVALAGLWAAVHLLLPHLWPTVTRVSDLRTGPSGSGIVVEQGALTADGDRLPSLCGDHAPQDCHTAPIDPDVVGFYRDLHPAAHHWPLHLTASGVLLVVAALLALAAFRVLRLRTAGPAGKDGPA